MSQRRSLLPLTALALAVTAAPAAAASCAPKGSKLVSAADGARVYSTATKYSIGTGKKTFVCSDRTGRRARIATEVPAPRGPAGEFVTTYRYAGRFFAAAIERGDSYDHSKPALIRRVDLGDGSQIVTNIALTGGFPSASIARVTDLVLDRKGWFAWIAHTGVRPDVYTVGRRDSRGVAELARGSDIQRRSLALGGTTLYWYAGGAPHDEDLF